MPENNYRLVTLIHPLTGLDCKVAHTALRQLWRSGWVPLAGESQQGAVFEGGPEPMTRDQVAEAMTRRAAVLAGEDPDKAAKDKDAAGDSGGDQGDGARGESPGDKQGAGKPARTGRGSGQSGE
jgi:hypothetical protein